MEINGSSMFLANGIAVGVVQKEDRLRITAYRYGKTEVQKTTVEDVIGATEIPLIDPVIEMAELQSRLQLLRETAYLQVTLATMHLQGSQRAEKIDLIVAKTTAAVAKLTKAFQKRHGG